MSAAHAASGRVRPSEDELRGWLDSLSNWGRWGPDDQRGTLNYIEPERVRAAAALVRSGKVVSCALPITYDRPAHPVSGLAGQGSAWKTSPMHFMLKGGEQTAPGQAVMRYAGDAFLMAPHGSMITHLDTPSHILFKGTMYNGISARRINLDHGAESGSVELAREGIVSRGVLLDVPAAQGREWLDDGEAIYPEDLEACETRAGLRVGRGDVLLVRTGYRKRNPRGPLTGRPGLQAACLPWLREREVALLTSDVTEDIHPHGYEVGSPMHLVGIWAMGLWLIDNCYLEPLAAACEAHRRWEFLLSIAPLVLTNATASPVNPLAIF